MSLDILLEPVPERLPIQPLCKVGKFQTDLAEPYKSALAALLTTSFNDGGLTDETLTERLNKAGLSVGATVVNRHRRSKCCCV
jgi:hypothetical protein